MTDSAPGLLQLFSVFLRLGLTSFGGPIAHLGYFRTEFVERRHWFSDREYADLVALCQFLPGPASSQVGFAVGHKMGGLTGALVAFLGFTAPSAVLLTAFGYGVLYLEGGIDSGLIAGLKVVAVAVVAHAVIGMGRNLCTDPITRLMAFTAVVVLLMWSFVYAQMVVIALGALGGLLLCRPAVADVGENATAPVITGRSWIAYLGLFVVLLLGLPVVAVQSGQGWLAQADSFYRAGALVFGGGHVVLPLLETGTVTPGWLSQDQFLAGYGAAQAVPGPLFTLAAYIGTVSSGTGLLSGWTGAMLAIGAIFLPGFLLLLAFLPHWQQLRSNAMMQRALTGVNATVVGLLAAVFINPVVTVGIPGPMHTALAGAAFVTLQFTKISPLPVVIACAGLGWLLL